MIIIAKIALLISAFITVAIALGASGLSQSRTNPRADTAGILAWFLGLVAIALAYVAGAL